MWIREVKVTGYGTLTGREFEFGPGLNCIYGANEAGKTTLLSFLVSMLYGQVKAGQTHRNLDAAHKHYRPWNAQVYGGKVVFLLSSGRERLISRDFSGTAEGIEIFEGGRSVRDTYDRHSNKEYMLVESHTEIDKRTFEGVFVVTHSSVAADGFAEKGIADRVAALASTGDEKTGAARACDVLIEAIGKIGSDRAYTQSYAVSRRKLEDAQAALELVQERRGRYAEALAERAHLGIEVDREEAAFSANRAHLVKSRKTALDALAKEREALQQEAKAQERAKALPEDVTGEEVARTQTELTNAEEALQKAGRTLEDARSQVSQAKEALAAAGVPTGLTGNALRQFQSSLSRFVEVRGRLTDRRAEIAKLRKEAAALDTKWGAGWTQAATARGSGQLALYAREAGKAKLSGGISAAVGVLAVAAGVLLLLAGSGIVRAAGLSLCAAAAVSAGYVAARAFARVAVLREKIGGQGVELDTDRAKAAQLTASTLEHETALSDLSKRIEEAIEALRDTAGQLGISLSGSLSAEVQNLLGSTKSESGQAADREGMFQDTNGPSDVEQALMPLWERCESASHLSEDARAATGRADAAANAVHDAEAEAGGARKDVDKLLASAGAKDIEELKGLVAGRKRLSEIRSELSDIAQRETICLGGMERGSLSDESAACEETPVSEQEIPSLAREVATQEKHAAQIRAQLKAAEATVAAGLEGVQDPAELEERIDELENRRNMQEFHKTALEKAREVIRESAEEFHRQTHPKLEASLAGLVGTLTGGRHEKVHLWTEKEGGLAMSVSDAASDTPVEPGALSQGTMEQIYLCARLALVEALSGKETLPVMLDDPFINYDAERLGAALEVLKGAAAGRQVFLMTCQRDVRDRAGDAGAALVDL